MYIIKKSKNDASIIYMEYDNKAYPIKNKNNSMHVDTIYLYDKKYLPKDNNALSFTLAFNDLTNIIFNYLYNNFDDEDDSSTTDLLLGELDKLKNDLESKYKEFLKREEYYQYLDKITFLKEELSNRKEIIKYRENINNIISGKSR